MSNDKIPTAQIFPADFTEIATKVFGQADFGAQSVQMVASDATTRVLVENASGLFGADLLRFPAGGMVPMHTHVGDHILIVFCGLGELLCEREPICLQPGLIYLIPGNVPHQINATTELVLVAIGNDRRPPGSKERLSLC